MLRSRPVEYLCKLDRVLQRELGPRPNREMGGMGRIAEQDDISGITSDRISAGESSAMRPSRADGLRSTERLAARYFANNRSHAAMLSSWRHSVEAEAPPRLFGAFDDEGRTVRSETVGMGPDPAMLGLLERERECVEHPRRAKPHELVPSNIDIDAERLGLGLAEPRVGAVRRNDKVVSAPFDVGRIAFRLEMKNDAQLACAILQDLEQPLAADANETVTTRVDRLATKMDIDIVPMRELTGDEISAETGSLRVMFSTVISEKTTPQPKVTPDGFLSKIRSRGEDRAASSRSRNIDRPGPHRYRQFSLRSVPERRHERH